MMIKKIISGGQTGVDRAMLDIAIELGIPCSGWCPKGRKAEDGPIHPRYPLQETSSASYPVRTEKNVKESDGTLVLTEGPPSGGTARTIELAKKHKKPCLVIDLGQEESPESVAKWVRENGIRTLNVAGPRESKCPGIHGRVREFLREMLERRLRHLIGP
jgi:predicted Rossmann-fold nucleotide-binding protein